MDLFDGRYLIDLLHCIFKIASLDNKVSFWKDSWGHHCPNIYYGRYELQTYLRPEGEVVGLIAVDSCLGDLWGAPVGDHHGDVHATDGHVDMPFHPFPTCVAF